MVFQSQHLYFTLGWIYGGRSGILEQSLILLLSTHGWLPRTRQGFLKMFHSELCWSHFHLIVCLDKSGNQGTIVEHVMTLLRQRNIDIDQIRLDKLIYISVIAFADLGYFLFMEQSDYQQFWKKWVNCNNYKFATKHCKQVQTYVHTLGYIKI